MGARCYMDNVWNNPKLGRNFLHNKYANLLTYVGQLCREANDDERELLNQYVHTESPEEQQEILKKLFPNVDDKYIVHFIDNTELVPEGWPDRIMDEESQEKRENFIGEWPIADTQGKIKILKNDNPYRPLNDEQRLWRKRHWKKGKRPMIDNIYWLRNQDDYDMPVRKHCIQEIYENLPEISIDEAALMVDTLFEKEKRVVFRFLDRQYHWQHSPECKAKQERECKEKEEKRKSNNVDDMISQDEIDLLLSVGPENTTAYYARETDDDKVASKLLRDLDSCINPYYPIAEMIGNEVQLLEAELIDVEVEKELSGEAPSEDDIKLWNKDSHAITLYDKICKYVLLKEMWNERKKEDYDIPDYLSEIRNYSSLEEFASIVLTPYDATRLMGYILACEIYDAMSNRRLWHSIPITNALLDVAITFKWKNTDFKRSTGIQDIIVSDEELFPKDTSIVEIVNILDCVVLNSMEKLDGTWGKR